MSRRTTITIFEETKSELDKFGKKNESYDNLLKRLISHIRDIQKGD